MGLVEWGFSCTRVQLNWGGVAQGLSCTVFSCTGISLQVELVEWGGGSATIEPFLLGGKGVTKKNFTRCNKDSFTFIFYDFHINQTQILKGGVSNRIDLPGSSPGMEPKA